MIFNKLKIPIDIIFSFFLFPASLIMLLFRKFGSHKLPISKKVLNFLGIFPLVNHYYEPQFNFNTLNKNLDDNRDLSGINFNKETQLKNLSNLIYEDELKELKLEKKSPHFNFKIENGFFDSGDAEIYYQLIRYLKPNKIL